MGLFAANFGLAVCGPALACGFANSLSRSRAHYSFLSGRRAGCGGVAHFLISELLANSRNLLLNSGSLLFQSNERSSKDALIDQRLSGHALIIA